MWLIVVGVAVVVVGYFAFALLYHWLRYGFLYPMVFVAIPIWGAGTFILFSIMLAAYAAL